MIGFIKKSLIVVAIAAPSFLYGQNNDNFLLKLGYGYYQGFNFNANYFYSQNHNLGIGIGSHFGLSPIEGEKHINIAIENNIHFGIQNKFYSKPWFFSQQVMYWRTESESGIWKILSISPTIGRVIALSNKLGIGLEIGPTLNIVLDVERKTPYESGWMGTVLYNGRIQLVYMF